MTITATLYTYYHLCIRKMWLHAHGITMEHQSDLVTMGRHLHETAYPRRRDRYREFQLEGAKIDHYDPQSGIIHEIKKSNRNEHVHVAQVKYYLWLLRKQGCKAERGQLEYPLLRQTLDVFLEDEDHLKIEVRIREIGEMLGKPCPDKKEVRSSCRNCSYEDFCWVEEESK